MTDCTADSETKSEEKTWQHRSLIIKARGIQQTRKGMLVLPQPALTCPLPWATTHPMESWQSRGPGDVWLLLMPDKYRKADTVIQQRQRLLVSSLSFFFFFNIKIVNFGSDTTANHRLLSWAAPSAARPSLTSAHSPSPLSTAHTDRQRE